jgi:hypothetical protein
MNKFEFNQELADFIKEGLKQIQWLDDIECIDERDLDDIICCLKDHFESSKFADGNEGEDYDEWYDEFSEETLIHYFERMW